jgi:hypothetical protein
VAGDDLFGVANGCEIDAGIPAEEYIDVHIDGHRYTLQLSWGQGGGFLVAAVVMRKIGMKKIWGLGLFSYRSRGIQKRSQQFGDAGGIHGQKNTDCRWMIGNLKKRLHA